jgi:hypothetical protein
MMAKNLRISFLQTGFEEKRHVPHHHCFFSFFFLQSSQLEATISRLKFIFHSVAHCDFLYLFLILY